MYVYEEIQGNFNCSCDTFYFKWFIAAIIFQFSFNRCEIYNRL